MKTLTVTSFKQWRCEARKLLQQNTPPAEVSWSADQQTQLLFTAEENPTSYQTNQTTIKVPKKFLDLARAAACFRDEKRWSLLYSVLWRMNHKEPHLLYLATDPEVRRLKHMRQAVHRDVHKMHAFVRFKQKQMNQTTWYVSWFEPSHNILAYTANFFVKRFNTMNWSILTPDACAHWDQKQLKMSPGMDKTEAQKQLVNDEMDDYWRQYYRHIFNPARLKTQAMQSEMPKKYWDNLPEAELIRELTKQSGQRTLTMLNNQTTDANRLRKKSKRLRQQQDAIRSKNQ